MERKRHFTVILALVSLLAVPGVTRAQEVEPASARAIESRALEHLAGGRQAEAEALLEQSLRTHGDDQGLVFLRAACKRSRFEVREARPIFAKVIGLDAGSVAGQCAADILALDAERDVEKHFAALEDLVDAHPDDVLLRWMIAVQCRALDRNEEGVAHYRRLMRTWNPGPSLVHQTCANLLSELGRHEEALVERRLEVEQEPAGWSFNSLGNTFAELERFDPAIEAYSKAVEHEPENGRFWFKWAWSLMKANHYEEALVKSARAAELDPQYSKTWRCWGYCLEKLERLPEALEKYAEAVRLDPKDDFSAQKLADLRATPPDGARAATPSDGYVEYGEHDVAQVLGTRTDESGKPTHYLDLRVVNEILDDLAAHAKNYPVTFKSEPERLRAERDAARMVSVIDIIAASDDADTELLLLMGRLYAIGHNLDLDGSADKANAYFLRLLQREPEHPLGNYNFGVFLASTATRNKEAVPYLEKAVALGMDDANYSLGMLHLTLQDKERGLACLEAYAAKRPGDQALRELIDAIKADEVGVTKKTAP